MYNCPLQSCSSHRSLLGSSVPSFSQPVKKMYREYTPSDQSLSELVTVQVLTCRNHDYATNIVDSNNILGGKHSCLNLKIMFIPVKNVPWDWAGIFEYKRHIFDHIFCWLQTDNKYWSRICMTDKKRRKHFCKNWLPLLFPGNELTDEKTRVTK